MNQYIAIHAIQISDLRLLLGSIRQVADQLLKLTYWWPLHFFKPSENLVYHALPHWTVHKHQTCSDDGLWDVTTHRGRIGYQSCPYIQSATWSPPVFRNALSSGILKGDAGRMGCVGSRSLLTWAMLWMFMRLESPCCLIDGCGSKVCRCATLISGRSAKGSIGPLNSAGENKWEIVCIAVLLKWHARETDKMWPCNWIPDPVR